MDGSAEGRGADGGCGAGAAVEVDAADPLRGEEGPGVMGGAVGVVEGDAVKVNVVIAVLKAAEVGLALTQAHAVGAGGKGAGNDLDDFAEVGDGRGEVLDIGVGDQGLGGTLFKKAAAGRGFRGNGIDAGVDRDHLRD